MKQTIEALSLNLKSLRGSRGLSLDQLSEQTGVSKSMLRQIETGQSNPTIATIWKIANGLKVSFTSLLSPPRAEGKIRSFKGSPPLTAGGEHYRIYPMIPFDPQQSFETYYLEFDPGPTFKGLPHGEAVYEYIFVLSGTLQVTVGSEEYTINEQEFLKFLANVPHTYTSVGTETATAIMQICYQ